MQRHFDNSEDICKYVADRSDTAILAFSCGKDSIAAWIQMRRYFKKIIPFYWVLVPGLSFIDESLKYYEDFFGSKIERIPSPSLYRMLTNLVFQAPENCSIVEDMELDVDSKDAIVKRWKRDIGVSDDTFIALGTRAVDSIMRRRTVKKWGALNPNRKSFLPVFDWNKARLKDELRGAGVKLPVDYEMFGRSFDGIDYRFLKPIKDRFPEDYQRILEFFPLAELEIKRREWRERYYEKASR